MDGQQDAAGYGHARGSRGEPVADTEGGPGVELSLVEGERQPGGRHPVNGPVEGQQADQLADPTLKRGRTLAMRVDHVQPRVPDPGRDLHLGVRIGGEKTKPCTVTRTGPASFRIVLTQGLNRQIRRMCSALGYRVRNLKRVRIMHIQLGSLATRAWRDLTDAEVAPLLAGAAARGRYT